MEKRAFGAKCMYFYQNKLWEIEKTDKNVAKYLAKYIYFRDILWWFMAEVITVENGSLLCEKMLKNPEKFCSIERKQVFCGWRQCGGAACKIVLSKSIFMI